MAGFRIFASLVLAIGVQAQIAAYGQCGGSPWCFNVDCQLGYTCSFASAYYSQCIPIATPPGTLAPYSGCGPPNTLPCSPGYSCVTANGYAMCTPIVHSTLTTVNTCPVTSTSSSSSSTKLSSDTSPLNLKSSTLSSTTSMKSTAISTSSKASSVVSTTSSKISSIANICSTSSTKSATVASSTTSKKSNVSSPSSSSTSTSRSTTLVSNSTTLVTSTSTKAVAPAQQTPYGQCGGIGWTGLTSCTSGYTCVPQAGNPYYSQCLPGTAPPPTTTTTTPVGPVSSKSTSSVSKPSTTLATSTQTGAPEICTPTPQNCGVTNSPPACAGKVKFAGINIAGCDFGTDTNGQQSPSGAYCPIGQYNPDGPGQMTHFASEKFNMFRLPTGWQYIINSGNPSSALDPTNFGNYNNLVQACLATGAYCLVGIHNYARFNGAIIGQGGPSNAVFAQLWANIATVYASNSKVIFGIMNEPHDVQSITTWAATVQAAVTAIRQAGAITQMILLPGNDWTGAGTFVNDGSGPALAQVTNPDGSTTNLIFDVHKYLDSDGSGTGNICVGDQVSTAFAPLAQWLRCNGRQAILSETGGSSDQSCLTYMCSAVSFLNANSDVYLGYIGWAAGSFSVSYNLGETPSYSNGVWTDMPLVTTCLVPH